MATQHWRVALLAGVAAGVLALSACGGGGDGKAGVPVVPPAAAPITAANYQGVAQQTVTAAMYMGDASGLVTGAQVAPGGQVLFNFTRVLVARVPALLARATPVASGATTTELIECSGGGSVSATLNDVNGNESADPGDSARLSASNCIEAGASINGVLALAFTAVSGDLNSDIYTASISVSLENLRAASDAGNVTGNGSFTLALGSTSATASTLEMNTASLSMAGDFGGTSDTITLQDFRLTSSTTLVAGRLRTVSSVSGGVASTTLAAGVVTVATLQPLVHFDTDAYPVSGQLAATGAAGSQVRLTVQNTSTVLLELDADGNGSFETSSSRAWSSLA